MAGPGQQKLRQYNQSPFDRWWFGPCEGPAPGRTVLFVGAGISIDQPTGLPGAVELTQALMHHLLDARVAEELLEIFARHGHVLGRKVPRLEALLSRAIGADNEAVQLLELFQHASPNRNHFLIARHLLRTRTWVITPNFDEGIERASDYQIPVHVLDLTSGGIRTLYGSPDADWGLIKIHGTTGLGVHGLAATLEQLTPGLHPAMRRLLDLALGSADLVVVAGYSGSDHFDVNAFLRLKMNEKYSARLLWVEHRNEHCELVEDPDTLGFRTFQSAFNGVMVRAAKTTEILSDLLGDSTQLALAATSTDWREQLRANSWKPTTAARHRIGAALTAHMGFATLAHECIAQLRRELDDGDACVLDEARACAVEGYWRPAYALLHSHKCQSAQDGAAEAASVLRAAGHPVRALATCANSRTLRTSPLGNWVMAASLLDVCRATLGLPWLIRKPVLAMLARWVDRCLAFIRTGLDQYATPSLKAKCQLLELRQNVYLERSNGGELRELIREEISYPDFYTERGALVPGYYLLCANTAAELDLLPELLDVRLEYADLLMVQVRQDHGDEIYSGLRGLTDRWGVEVALLVIKEQLELARAIAEMLNEDHARTRVARAWLQADEMFVGLHRWKQQRLYLADRQARRSSSGSE